MTAQIRVQISVVSGVVSPNGNTNNSMAPSQSSQLSQSALSYQPQIIVASYKPKL